MFSIMFMVTCLRFLLSMFLLCDPLVEVLMVLFGKFLISELLFFSSFSCFLTSFVDVLVILLLICLVDSL